MLIKQYIKFTKDVNIVETQIINAFDASVVTLSSDSTIYAYVGVLFSDIYSWLVVTKFYNLNGYW